MSEEQTTSPAKTGSKVVRFVSLAELAKESRKFNIKGCQTGRVHQIQLVCPKCKRLVDELDETLLCPWCVSLEEEC